MSIALVVKISCPARLLLVVVAGLAVAVTVRADVEHFYPIDDMGLRVGTGSLVVTEAQFDGLLFHLWWLLFLPCLGCVGEAQEFGLDDFFFGR